MRNALLLLTLLLPALAHAQAPPLHTLASPSPEPTGRFGDSVSGVADADGDGVPDLLVGAYLENGGAPEAGRAYLFSGATGALRRTLTSPDPEQEGGFGNSVAGVADVDGDGRGDLLVGALREDGGMTNAGRAYLFGASGLIVSASGNPTTIVPGGTITVTATVSNDTTQPVPLDLWVVATRNGSALLTEYIGSGTLPAGATVTRSFSLPAPGNTPAGSYTVVVNVGDFQSRAVFAADAFDVIVTGAPPRSGTPAPAPVFAVAPLSGDVFAADASASSVAAPSSSSVSVSPNPFSRQTVLRFARASASPVRLSVHDVLGREVAVLMDGQLATGTHTAVFDAAGLASGVYVWRLASGSTVQTGRLTLLE